MKISDVTIEQVADFLRLPEGSYSETELYGIMDAATAYIEGYTGIPLQSDDSDEKSLDDYDDFALAYLILCQDLYDNRTAAQNSAAVNRTLEAILGMHGRNLCG